MWGLLVKLSLVACCVYFYLDSPNYKVNFSRYWGDGQANVSVSQVLLIITGSVLLTLEKLFTFTPTVVCVCDVFSLFAKGNCVFPFAETHLPRD